MKKKRKSKKINIILSLICFLMSITLISISIFSYKKETSFFNKAEEIEGYIFGVRKKSSNTYSFEYKYVVNKEIYKTYLSSYKTDKELKDYDKFTVYYEKGNPEKNMIRRPKKTKILLTIPFSLFLLILGIWTLRRKKL